MTKQLASITNRLNKFYQDLHDFLTNDLGLKNVPTSLTFNQIIKLKHIVSDVNNIITLSMTSKFVDLLGGDSNNVDSNPNANGYDLVYPSIDAPEIIAEVKSTIPCTKQLLFGAQQKHEIIKDIDGLKNRKSKSQVSKEDLAQSIKVLIMLDRDDVRKASKYLLKTDHDVLIIDNDDFIEQFYLKKLSNKKVYVVYINLL